MEYRNWNKNSNPRNCSGSNCPLGEPQDSPTKLCLHGAVDSLGKGKEQRTPLNALGGNIEGKGQGKGKGKGRWPTQGDCYTWGNQEECSKPMAFVCKKRRFPCLGKAKTHQQQFQPKTLQLVLEYWYNKIKKITISFGFFPKLSIIYFLNIYLFTMNKDIVEYEYMISLWNPQVEIFSKTTDNFRFQFEIEYQNIEILL